MWQGRAATAGFRIALRLTDLDARDALSEALASHPALTLVNAADAPDVVVTDRPDASGAGRTLCLGDGPLPADAPPDLVLSAAYVVAAGLDLAVPSVDAAPPPPRLSPREREVLALLVDGAPNKAIARSLDISLSTVKFHVAGVLGKLGARNRAEAVAIGLREGLVAI